MPCTPLAKIIRLRQGKHLLWLFTKQPPHSASTLPLKRQAESALPLPFGIIRLH